GRPGRRRPTRSRSPRPPPPRQPAPAGGESSWPAQHVADAADRLEHPRLAPGLELPPQIPDVHLETVRGTAEVVAPDAIHDQRAGQDSGQLIFTPGLLKLRDEVLQISDSFYFRVIGAFA